ncbi:DEAD/DEAH box helicase [Rhizobium sp. CFBP 8762]|uniref:DEAD/DEAH box helicase n=1 Tax=Rhizobium sp. CFBP 8762 TaxID=2775279 RepID=UPI00177BD31A|nr:DEAD/DEAH box helicase [Rhizobium sp. CFBP 8762]MBD8554689.1 DEAD/DEAH box helicase [Rhizobium sp. CFBP 8762]
MTTFADLGLSQKVLSAVTDAGYTTPTPIQAGAIPPALQRRDILGIAQTGTGKTASFVLPMLTLLEKGRARARMPRTLILEPTRELAAQVAENFEKYGRNHKLNIALLIGGVSFDEQDRKLERGADVLICTPGRLLDHCERGKLLMTGVEILVIDEADRMLDMGFIPDIERIAKLIPFTRQTLFFSATMPPEIQKLADRFLQNPERIEVSTRSSTATTVKQLLVATHGKDYEKRAVLRDIIRAQDDLKNAIIFCNRKKDVADLFRSLERHGFSVGALHGDMDQTSRTAMLAGFKNNQITLLVASDVAARGLDIPDVSHVFNFDVPIHAEDYVHRIGRTGRAGRAGAAFTLVTKKDQKFAEAIEKLIDKQIEWMNGDLSALPAPMESFEPAKTGRDGRREGGRTRGRDRDRTGRPSSSHKTDIISTDTVIPSEPVAIKAEPVRTERTARTEQPKAARDFRDDVSPSRNNRQSPYPANDDRRNRYRRDQDDGPTPVGFGDDIPAFMLVAGKY